MGKLLKKFPLRTKNNPAPAAAGGTAAAGPKAPHSASWLLAKHRADQGLGAQPADPAAPTVGGSAVPAPAPAGGMVDEAEELKRKRAAGIQL